LSFIRQGWRSRGVARALVERELRARYKQATLGIAWAFAAPLGYVVVFTIFFDRTAEIETFGKPYPVFAYAALIPWGFFAQSMTRGSTAVIDNIVLLNKVACPRETFVMAAIGTSLVDSFVAAVAFPIVVIALGESFYAATVFLIPVLVVQVAFGAGFALLVGSVLIYVRDVRHLLPLITQLLMFATPVVWGLQAFEQNLSRSAVIAYSAANPMAAVCESYRRTLVYGDAPDWPLLGVAGLSAGALLAVGYYVFKRLEPGFADVA
jgi:ABC-type polysaccharide/polyol phosphate export permease